MRSPRWYQLVAAIGEHLPNLRPAQLRGLAAWVFGTIQAKSGCESSVLRELVTDGGQWEAWRARLREFIYDGKEKAAPCQTEVPVADCFAPLFAWVVGLWQGGAPAVGHRRDVGSGAPGSPGR